MDLANYNSVLLSLKKRVKQAQNKAMLAVNSELINLYFDIGEIIHTQQQKHQWGAKIISKIAADFKNEMPEIKGFSERNLKFMVQFYLAYTPIGKQAVSQLEKNVKQAVSQIPWGHNILLLQKIKDSDTRLKYIEQIVKEGWSRNTLNAMIKGDWHLRQGKTISNFKNTLPLQQSGVAQEMLKDPYLFDFLTLTEPYTERELELELIKHLEKFLLELGSGFSFVGRQYHIAVSNNDYYIDLLFYHLKLRAFVVVELKKGDFKPEYAGKLNFYCSVIDDTLKHPTDQATIGLLLCQNKDKIIAEYALKDINKPVGISEYELTQALPKTLKSSLPSISQLENELLKNDNHDNKPK